MTNFPDQIPSCMGELNPHSIKVHRDKGCNCVLVRRNLVHDDQLAGDHLMFILTFGSEI